MSEPGSIEQSLRFDENGQLFNGIDPKTGEMYAFGKKVKVLDRKPRRRKEGSMDFKYTGHSVVGKLRAMTGMVGGLIDADHRGPIKNPVERAVERHLSRED